eukprot:Platyproteum_vivax@DN4721_c0_g1_i1.p1
MGWWPFGSNKKPEDIGLAAPPVGNPLVPPPEIPSTLKNNPNLSSPPTTSFLFSDPPPVGNPDIKSGLKLELPSFSSKNEDQYENADYSSFTSSLYESSGVRDYKMSDMAVASPGPRITMCDRLGITHPRVRNCVESIYMGSQMGA